jgi:hypothetical protein
MTSLPCETTDVHEDCAELLPVEIQQRFELVDAQGHEGTGESHNQDARSCCGDQVNRPRVTASASQIEVSKAVFVPICLKAHVSGLLLRVWPSFNSLWPKQFHEIGRQARCI